MTPAYKCFDSAFRSGIAVFCSGTSFIAPRLPRFFVFCLLAMFLSAVAGARARAAIPSPETAVAEIAQDPKLQKLVQQADAALLNGDVKLALVLLKEAVLLQPRNGELHARLGI